MFVRTLALMVATFALLVPMGAPVSAAPDNYTPKAGPTFNSPLGSKKTQRAIFRKILRSINSTPRRGEIDVFSWNILTRDGVDALLRAARRGVRVRVLMDQGNRVLPNGDRNSSYFRLKRGLRNQNKGRPKHRKNWARVCDGTCRGGGGAAHSKFFLFSKAGKARRVYMHGSANLTVASTTNQWNDLYTHRGNRGVWKWANRRFAEASRDKRARDVYSTRSFRKFRLMMFPNTGKNSPDPVMQMLNRVRCKGATNTRSGRTILRMAPDVLRNDRGMRIAKRIRYLWNHGCTIRLGYTVVGIDIGKYLRRKGGRGPVPMKHLVQDFDHDGDFDNYFHLKSMTIRGRYAKDRSGLAMLNGSANWSGLGMVSDENLGIYRAKRRVTRYEKHLKYWYGNFPSARTSYRTGAPGEDGLKDQLVFGSGANAVYEDGTPVSTDGSNPFATMPQD